MHTLKSRIRINNIDLIFNNCCKTFIIYLYISLQIKLFQILIYSYRNTKLKITKFTFISFILYSYILSKT